ncbi:MAG: hypothetical protein JWR55_1037 [Aeromicrobium sp.]|jgi:hypothetical protein|nr:hypothetical protein [Aeromicrobium sp.]
MLTRTATRRSAVVLTVALVAMLLVALSGSARTGQHRTSAGNGHSVASPIPGRHTATVPLAPHDHTPWHLDLASTPPADALVAVAGAGVPAQHHDTSIVMRDAVVAVGRAPPVL